MADNLSGWNILLVDDDPAGLEVLQEVIGFYGGTTNTAWNGQKALELTQEESFDLVVTDLQMPGMDGLELTKTLKSNEATAKIPVIIITAHSLDHESAREAGCDGLMTKPVHPASLFDELKKLLPDRL